MTEKVHAITVDINNTYTGVVSVNQNNNNADRLEITVTNSGTAYDLTGLTARFAATKPDGTVIFNNIADVDEDTSTVTIDLTANVLAVNGFVVFELQFYEETSLVSTAVMNLHIRPSAVGNGETITSSNEFGALIDALAEVDEAITDADEATTSANNAATSANTAAGLANTKAGLADTAANLANTKAEYANTQGNYAKTQGDYAKSKGDYANEKALLADTKAGLANSAADNANTKAGLANTAAEYANTKGDYANEKGNYAKDKGDYAKEQGDYAYEQAENIDTTIQSYIAPINNTLVQHSNEIADHEDRISLLENLQPLNEYADIQTVTRAGKADKYLSVGEQITVFKESAITANKGDSVGITGVSINEETFLAQYPHAFNGELTFIYDDSKWFLHESEVSLTAYGLTITGTPANGDEIIVHESASELDFDILDFDKETPNDSSKTHSITLGLHDVFTYGSIPFCPSQMLWCADREYPAGTYNITLYKSDYGGGTSQDGTYQFTTTVPIPAMGGIRHSTIGAYQSSYTKQQILNGTLYVYGEIEYTDGIASRPTLARLTLTEGSEGTSLGTFSAEYQATATNDEYHNFTRRNAYGDHRWIYSVDRQWLNSSAAVNEGWFEQKTNFDMPPTTTVQKWAGFLHGLDTEFANTLGYVKVISASGNSDRLRGAPNYYETVDKIFLQSMTNLGFGNNNGVAEGSMYSYWEGATNADRIKYLSNTARYWWLRSCNPSYSYYTRNIFTTGALSYSNAYSIVGVVPACVII